MPVSSAINKNDNNTYLIGVLGGLNELIHVMCSVSKVPGTKQASSKHDIRQTSATHMKEAVSVPSPERLELWLNSHLLGIHGQNCLVTFKMLPTVSP